MMRAAVTWLVGDVHGCAAELAELLARPEIERGDRVLLLGDLFHRGPDPLGVLALVRELELAFLLGNHEVAMLRRLGWDAAAPRIPGRLAGLDEADVRGDSQRELVAPAAAREALVRFVVERHAGLWQDRASLGGGPTPDGRDWVAVHAGVTPGLAARESRPDDLVWPARVGGPRGRWWFQEHRGPELIVFGHRVEPRPRRVRRAGLTVALGIDTGCVGGGRLTAYAPELDRWIDVASRCAP